MNSFFWYPILCCAVLIGGICWPAFEYLYWLTIPAVALAVISSVHHAEVVAQRVGEPFGTLVLALAITVIEVALVVSMMIAGGSDSATVPRDTIYAAVMIICNGVVGICLVLGGLRHKEQIFRIEGTNSGLAALVVMSTLVLVLPTFTVSSPGASYTVSQLIFVAIGSMTLWFVFVFIQTIRHRDYFLPAIKDSSEDAHATPPTLNMALISFGLLLAGLVSVVGLAKLLSPTLESVVREWQAPKAVVGTVIAILVLAPETWAAIRAARANRLQTSMNLAIGSALASIGLTIPAVVMVAYWLKLPLLLGLGPKDIALLFLSFIVAAITLGSGRTNVMQGAVHLVIFAAFLFLTFVP